MLRKTSAGYSWACRQELQTAQNRPFPSVFTVQESRQSLVWSGRVGSHYRDLAAPIESGFLWVWIGTHAEYDKLLA